MSQTPNNFKNTTFTYHNHSLNKIIERRDILIKQAELFCKKFKGYTHIYKIEKDPVDGYMLVFKVVPKDSRTVNEYNNLLKVSAEELIENELISLGIQA